MNNQIQDEIDQLLTCYICQRTLNDPYQCAFCSQASCRSCLMAWMEKQNTCPTCRNEIGTILVSPYILKSVILQNILNLKQDKCKIHKSDNEFYCGDCDEVICKLCIVYDDHKKHNITLSKIKLLELKESLTKVQKEKIENLTEIKKQFYAISHVETWSYKFENQIQQQKQEIDQLQQLDFKLSQEVKQHLKQQDELLEDEQGIQNAPIQEKIQLNQEQLENLQKSNSSHIYESLEKLREISINRISPPSKYLEFVIKFSNQKEQQLLFSIWENIGKISVNSFQNQNIKFRITFSLPITYTININLLLQNDKIFHVMEITHTSNSEQDILEKAFKVNQTNEFKMSIEIFPSTYFYFCEQMIFYMWKMEKKLQNLGLPQFNKLQNSQELGKDTEVIIKKVKQAFNKEILEQSIVDQKRRGNKK